MDAALCALMQRTWTNRAKVALNWDRRHLAGS